jgi:hypothetical protein
MEIAEGGLANAKRIERRWRREGLKIPARQPRRGRMKVAEVDAVVADDLAAADVEFRGPCDLGLVRLRRRATLHDAAGAPCVSRADADTRPACLLLQNPPRMSFGTQRRCVRPRPPSRAGGAS